MGKLQFFEMRAEQMATLYPADFTKKEAQKQGVKLVTDLLESGEVDKMQFIANLARLNEVLSSAMAEARQHIDCEKQTVMGVEFTPVNGGNTPQFEEDETYRNLKNELKGREEILKLSLASKDAFYFNGEEIQKVSTKPRASSITIKF